MEPIPETTRALAELARYGVLTLDEDLAGVAQRALDLVPDLVGMSLTLVTEDITLTYLATSRDVAALDGVQFADGGPGTAAAELGEPLLYDEEALMDEPPWEMFAASSVASGVHSTLSLPIMEDGDVTSCINLYASQPGTFDGRQDELARVFGAWAPGVVANADLLFTSRLEAQAAPSRLDDMATVDRAVDRLAATRGVSTFAARRILAEAAARAGVTLLDVAQMVLRGGAST